MQELVRCADTATFRATARWASTKNHPTSFLDSIEKVYGFNVPRKHGYDTVECIHAMHEGKVKVFLAMGGNFLSATPDTTYTAEALRKCKLTVQISTKLNRSHLITGKEALILPTFGRSDKDVLNGEEQFVTTENSMGVVQMSKGSLKPISGDMLSEPVIVSRLALAVFGKNYNSHWEKYLKHYDNIRDDIERVIPGFENYNQRVRKPGGFYLAECNEGKIVYNFYWQGSFHRFEYYYSEFSR